jgi:hypothetical protein
MALAHAANAGTLYPPLYDGEAFGGTRFMPVPIVLEAGAARLTGEYLVSAKLLSYLLAASLLVLTYWLLRRDRCPAPVAVLLTSTLLVTGTGLSAATSIRNDVLPVVLQLVALALVGRPTARRAAVAAGALCALALVSKLSAVWAPMAIAVWMLRYDRRALTAFAAGMGAVLAVAAVSFEILSGGRMTENVLGLSVSSADRVGSLHDQVARIRLAGREGLGWLSVLVAFGGVLTALAVRRRALSLFDIAFVLALLVTAVVLLDPGAFLNHLIDVQVLSLLVIGEWWGRRSTSSSPWRGRAPVVVAVVLLAVSATYRENVPIADDLRALFQGTTAADERVPPLAGRVQADDRLLSEDPSIPVLRGESPVVLDPYMLFGILDAHPAWRDDLVRRIERGEFDKVVLLDIPSSAPFRYRRLHFGSAVVRAIERRYRPAVHAEGYWIYVPKRPAAELATGPASTAPAAGVRGSA